jgi:hypothetical protein
MIWNPGEDTDLHEGGAGNDSLVRIRPYSAARDG